MCRSPFLISQYPTTFLIKASKFFLVDIAKLSRTPFLQELFEAPDSVFMEHICNYGIIKCNVNNPKWLFEPFETKCVHMKLKLREHEKLFSYPAADDDY